MLFGSLAIMTLFRSHSHASASSAFLGYGVALAVFGSVCAPAWAQGVGDRAAHRAAREHQQMREQMRAERERRMGNGAAPVSATQPSSASAFAPVSPAIPKQLSAQERMQLREQLRQASRQRQPTVEPLAP